MYLIQLCWRVLRLPCLLLLDVLVAETEEPQAVLDLHPASNQAEDKNERREERAD